MKIRALSLLAALLAAGGCAVGPDYGAPALAIADGWVEGSAGTDARQRSTDVPASWWSLLGDEALAARIEQAAAGNLDVRAATARIEQARAARGIARSAFWPQVAAGASYTDVEQSVRSPAGAGSLIEAGFIPRDIDFYGAGVDASWELDLFGGNRRRAEAAAADVGASVAERDAIRLAALAETASAWFEFRGAGLRLAIAERNIESQRQTLELTRRVVESGLARRIDLLRAEAQLDATRAGVPALRAAMRASHYRLAVLTGRPPGALPAGTIAPELPEAPVALPVGTPADILRRRPDVVAAERRLAAATAGIGIAKAEFFPRLVLSASYGFEAASAADLGDGDARTTTLLPFVSWPVFQGGRLQAQLDGAGAQALEASLGYEQAVITAIADAEAALGAYAEELASFASLSAASAASREAADIARRLYEQGLADFLTVLDADRRSFEAEDRQAQSHTRLLLGLVRVYKALGGGWEFDDSLGPRKAAATAGSG